MICIYMITNTITNERYIDQTRDYQRRLRQHKSAAKNGSYLKISKAIAKYGIDNFKFDVLEECSLEELNIKERYYISELKPEYNVCAGGIGPNGLHLTDEEKERSRQAAEYVGIDPSGITSVLKGRQRKAGGYKWLYQL